MQVRKILPVLLILVLISLASATTFGTMTSENRKAVDDNQAWFHIDTINMGDEPLQIEVETIESNSDTEVRFNVPGSDSTGFRQYVMEQSDPTSNPSGGQRWFAMGDGKYVPFSRIRIKAIVDEKTDNPVSRFTVRVSASSASEDEEDSSNVDPKQNVVQVREYDFTVATQGSELKESDKNERGVLDTITEWGSGLAKGITGSNKDSTNENNVPSSPTNSENSKDISSPEVTVESSEAQQQSVEETSLKAESSETDISQRSAQGAEGKETKKKTGNSATGSFLDGFTSITTLLILALLVSTVYLVKVI